MIPEDTHLVPQDDWYAIIDLVTHSGDSLYRSALKAALQ